MIKNEGMSLLLTIMIEITSYEDKMILDLRSSEF